MPSKNAHDGVEVLLEHFETLIQCLDEMSTLHDQAWSTPEVITHVERAKSLANRGAELARRHIETKPN